MKKGKSFIEVLKQWKEYSWHMFAAQSTKRDTKRFWCNMNGQYKVTLKSKEEPIYQGDNIKEACKIYDML